jgi:glycylpeptide N-tetradecanoyltransferase
MTKEELEPSTEPYTLPDQYYWSVIDLQDPKQLNQVYKLLKNHYSEDEGMRFRFDYSADFLKWAMNVPGYHPEWIVGVKSKDKDNLYAFISGIPVDMTINKQNLVMCEINFLCIHKHLREKRLAPMMIKEIHRRVAVSKVWAAVYTADGD